MKEILLREERAILERKILLRQAAERLAHEIRNPLGTLRGQIQLVLRKLKDRKLSQKLEESMELLDRVVDATERLFALDYDAKLQLEDLDLIGLLEELLEAYQRRFQRRKVELRCRLPRGPIGVRGDRHILLLALECLMEGILPLTRPAGGDLLELECRHTGLREPDVLWLELTAPRFLSMPEDDRWRTYDPLLFDHGFAEAWPFSVAQHLLSRHRSVLRLKQLPDGRARLRMVMPKAGGGKNAA